MNSIQHIANVSAVQPVDVQQWLVENGYQVPNTAPDARFERYFPTDKGALHSRRVVDSAFHAWEPVQRKTWLVWDEIVTALAKEALRGPTRSEYKALADRVVELEVTTLVLLQAVHKLVDKYEIEAGKPALKEQGWADF